VSTLDCRNTTMNGHMRNALKAAQAPEIRFHATSVRVNATSADAGTAEMQGTLSIAGQDRPTTINAQVVKENGQIRVRGTKHITMTDWGVRPPSLMLGAMKVNPAVTVGFDVVLKP
jgi:polyisoprenoid-binding protein YceI